MEVCVTREVGTLLLYVLFEKLMDIYFNTFRDFYN